MFNNDWVDEDDYDFADETEEYHSDDFISNRENFDVLPSKNDFQAFLENNSSFLNFLQCPICSSIVEYSSYLFSIFSSEPFSYWAACLVTHYRHCHIKYYDNSWRFYWYGQKNKEYSSLSHEDYKIIVNNRAKRQLIRSIRRNTLFEVDIKKRLINGFQSLQSNDEKTTKLIEKTLKIVRESQK